MIGLLPTNRQNLELPNQSIENFVNDIMNELSKSPQDIVNCLKENEWDLFENGLTILLGIQLLSKQNANSIELLLNEAIEPKRLSILKRTIDFFEKLIKDIPEPMWFELLVLDSPDNLIKRIRRQKTTFEAYISYATKIIPVLTKHPKFRNELSPHFDALVNGDRFNSKYKLI